MDHDFWEKRLSDALKVAADQRRILAELNKRGLPGAGAQAMANGALKCALKIRSKQGGQPVRWSDSANANDMTVG